MREVTRTEHAHVNAPLESHGAEGRIRSGDDANATDRNGGVGCRALTGGRVPRRAVDCRPDGEVRQVQPCAPPDLTREPLEPVQFEGGDYQAEFYFSDQGKLTLVRLTPKDQTQCRVLMETFTARYGKSSNEHHGEWTDPRTGDRIFQSKESKYGPCHTTYNKPGLPTSIY